MTNKTYIVEWRIEGSYEIVAPSKEEAQAIFDNTPPETLAKGEPIEVLRSARIKGEDE